jgi:hypothetical protein
MTYIVIFQNATPIQFADGTSIIITEQNLQKLKEDLNTCCSQLSEWFQLNSLSLNISKSYFIHFSSKNLNVKDINITHENNFVTKVKDINFLGININNTLSWETHTEKIVPKLSSARFAMRTMKPYMSPDIENNLLCISPLYNYIWHNFLGSHNTQYESIQNAKENCENYDRE